MYAKRNMEAALNNQLLFMETAREDGRIPGSIAMIDGVLTPQFNKFQGFCFPAPALNMYYLMGPCVKTVFIFSIGNFYPRHSRIFLQSQIIILNLFVIRNLMIYVMVNG
mgnify:CR=1 FL=1